MVIKHATDHLRVTTSRDGGIALPADDIDAIVNAAAQNRCHWVLLDARNQGRQPTTMDCFEFADLIGQKRPWPFFVMALVVREEIIPSTRFAEIVASNRGVFLRVFDNDSDALTWLRKMTGDYRAPCEREAS
jgi:hypothetical protein